MDGESRVPKRPSLRLSPVEPTATVEDGASADARPGETDEADGGVPADDDNGDGDRVEATAPVDTRRAARNGPTKMEKLVGKFILWFLVVVTAALVGVAFWATYEAGKSAALANSLTEVVDTAPVETAVVEPVVQPLPGPAVVSPPAIEPIPAPVAPVVTPAVVEAPVVPPVVAAASAQVEPAAVEAPKANIVVNVTLNSSVTVEPPKVVVESPVSEKISVVVIENRSYLLIPGSVKPPSRISIERLTSPPPVVGWSRKHK